MKPLKTKLAVAAIALTAAAPMATAMEDRSQLEEQVTLGMDQLGVEAPLLRIFRSSNWPRSKVFSTRI